MSRFRIPTEHQEQAAFVQWFRMSFPKVRIFAIPNGGARSKATAGKLKAEGVSPGVPDLFVPEWGLFIEMKRTRGGSLSDVQDDWIDYLEDAGYTVLVCKGCDAAIVSIKAHLKEAVDGQA